MSVARYETRSRLHALRDAAMQIVVRHARLVRVPELHRLFMAAYNAYVRSMMLVLPLRWRDLRLGREMGRMVNAADAALQFAGPDEAADIQASLEARTTWVAFLQWTLDSWREAHELSARRALTRAVRYLRAATDLVHALLGAGRRVDDADGPGAPRRGWYDAQVAYMVPYPRQ